MEEAVTAKNKRKAREKAHRQGQRRKQRHKAAVHVRMECGTTLGEAQAFVSDNRDEIASMVTKGDEINWDEFPAAAAGLWRRKANPDE